MKNHILWPPERPQKTLMCHMKVSFRAIWETWETPPNISCLWNGKVRFWAVYVFLTKIFGSKLRALFFLLIIFIKVEKKIRLRLTEIPWVVKLSGKTAMISTKPRPPQNHYLFWIDHHLVGKSSFKRRTEVFSSYVIGEMFRTNRLFVDSVANV